MSFYQNGITSYVHVSEVDSALRNFENCSMLPKTRKHSSCVQVSKFEQVSSLGHQMWWGVNVL